MTFPAPDLGFMIRNGRRGRAAGTAGMAASGPPALSAALAVPAAATISATATMATHSRLARVNATRMSTGAATARASASHRRTPRLARNQYPPARTAHTPIAANAISVRLCHPATASTSATAASIRANEARASQRRVIVLIRYHPHRKCVVPPGMKTTLAWTQRGMSSLAAGSAIAPVPWGPKTPQGSVEGDRVLSRGPPARHMMARCSSPHRG